MIGDRTCRQEGSTDLTLCYPASGQPRPHAVTTEYSTPATCGTGTPLSAFGYQDDGAMIASGDQGSGQRGGHAFDAENRLTEVLSAPANTSGGGFSCVDIDGDAAITNADANIIMADNGLRTGDPGYNYLADINQDGVITAGMSPGTDYFLELVARGSACGNTQDKYTYDGNGKLLKREHLVQSAGGWTAQSWTVYIGGVYEMHSDGSVTKYYAGQGRTVAIRTVPSNGGAGALSFPVTDHLGSTRALLDANGAVASTASYWPYGALRNFTVGLIVETDKLYTGQRSEWGDAALGLYNYNARFYSTTLGAFVSADATNGGGPNRYWYTNGNPLRYTDPTGHTCAPAMPGLGTGAGDPGDCPADSANGSNDAGAPCGSLCVALEQLAALTPAQLQYARDVATCAANPVACGALQRAHDVAACAANLAACTALAPPGSPGGCTFPCPGDAESCATQSWECTAPGIGGQQDLACAMSAHGCQQGATQPRAPGDDPWDPSNSGQDYTGYRQANAVTHIAARALANPQCREAIYLGVAVGAITISEAVGTDGIGLAASAQSNATELEVVAGNIATSC